MRFRRGGFKKRFRRGGFKRRSFSKRRSGSAMRLDRLGRRM